MAADYTAFHLAISIINCEMDLFAQLGRSVCCSAHRFRRQGQGRTDWGSTARFAQSAAYAARSTEVEADCGVTKLARSIGTNHLRYDADSYIAHYEAW